MDEGLNGGGGCFWLNRRRGVGWRKCMGLNGRWGLVENSARVEERVENSGDDRNNGFEGKVGLIKKISGVEEKERVG